MLCPIAGATSPPATLVGALQESCHAFQLELSTTLARCSGIYVEFCACLPQQFGVSISQCMVVQPHRLHSSAEGSQIEAMQMAFLLCSGSIRS